MADRAAYIEPIVAQIVEAVGPVRVVLFGSHARGNAGPDSDVDLLVVISDDQDRRAIMNRLYSMPSKELDLCPVDFIVATESHYEQYRDQIGTIFPTITREGRELYAAA